MREGIAVCQSLPGPLAIQVGIWISYIRGGFWGAWAGGWAFILPNFIIVAALGALYVRLEGLPAVAAIFYGVSPAVIALILYSCYRLTKLGMKDWLEWALAAAAFVITVAVQAEVALVFIGCGVVGLLYYGSLFRARASSTTRVFLFGVPLAVAGAAPSSVATLLGQLLAFFLKAGSLTFGSGLVIVPFLEKGLVQQMRWLNERDFLVAVAIGMISPGPVVITATFVGYLVAGFWGSLVSTIGIFFPSFILVLVATPTSGASQRRSQCPRFRQGRLWRGDRNDPGRLRPARPDRHRRLADRSHRGGVTGSSLPLESEQSTADGCHGGDWPHRVPAAAADMGDGQIAPG